ncbi:MAG: hypothetical protein SF028_01575 [Candidatus Sumerlaeia bacterium]|nr:hypothetical protein [Candidatus Sumerlaeia bacterium]
MNRKNPALILVPAAVAVALLALVLSRAGREDTPAPAVDTRTAAAATPRPAPTPFPTPAPTPEPTPTPEAIAAPARTLPQGFVKPDGTALEPLELSLDPDLFAELLAFYGSVEAMYERASEAERMDIINALQARGEVRDNIAGLLAMEDSTELRQYMLDRTEPKGFADLSINQLEYRDTELARILSTQPSTPMSYQELRARLDLSYMVAPEHALDFARKGFTDYDEDSPARIIAASTLLNLKQTGESVSDDEVQRASSHLMTSLSGGNFRNYDPDERMRAYSALYLNSDRDSVRRFYNDRLNEETDPRAVTTITLLLDQMDREAAEE